MENTTEQNPLKRFYRQPQLWIKLPSGGNWWTPNSIDLPENGEIAVYAMSGRDELLFKTPDALMNGQSTVDVIQSCVPAIKNAWEMPTCDMDAVLIAIRIATYGNEMEFTSKCPHCNSDGEYNIDLHSISDKIQCPDYYTTVSVEDLEIKLKPQSYKQTNIKSIENYQEQRLLQMVSDDSIPEEDKMKKFQEMFKKLVTVTVNQIASNIAWIKTPDDTIVNNEAFIHDFFVNCDKKIFDAVSKRLQELTEKNTFNNINLTCENEDCRKEFKSPLLFEQSNFFG